MRQQPPSGLAGLLLGGAVGDALGLPAEGLSASRQRRWWPGVLRHRFFFGRGMISDDTEHAFMTAQALLEADGEVERFRRSLAWKLRWWFVALPAGVGLATARACFRLWLGVPAERSGVMSAGNGPAMRSAIIGAVFADVPVKRRAFLRASTRLTHLDPRAETAALAVAEAAAWIVRNEEPIEDFAEYLPALDSGDEWLGICHRVADALAGQESVDDFAASLGLVSGVSGYAFHTVPVALYAWLRHREDFVAAVTDSIRCGGDSDTVAAIVGALSGCETGVEDIPLKWREDVADWPRSPSLLERMANELGSPNGKPVRWFWLGVLPRNLFFLAVVLAHGFRRLLPPY
jgi:ADP-ribosyl-[dinitrogen reductase] hydrolase